MEQLGLFEDNLDADKEVKTKTCNKCNKEKLLSEFSNASGGNYLRSECKSCNNELKKIRDRLRIENPLPDDDYECPICGRDKEGASGLGGKNNGPWVLDHCHVTGKFRGYLCHDCNRKLGSSNSNIGWLDKAREYILRGS